MSVKIVTDSTSDLPDDLAKQLDITVVPLNVNFDDVVYIEGRHVIEMSKERYLGAWNSVNDLRAQLGPAKFGEFLQSKPSFSMIKSYFLVWFSPALRFIPALAGFQRVSP